MTYKPSEEWLESDERVYPVTLDPTVNIPHDKTRAYYYGGDGSFATYVPKTFKKNDVAFFNWSVNTPEGLVATNANIIINPTLESTYSSSAKMYVFNPYIADDYGYGYNPEYQSKHDESKDDIDKIKKNVGELISINDLNCFANYEGNEHILSLDVTQIVAKGSGKIAIALEDSENLTDIKFNSADAKHLYLAVEYDALTGFDPRKYDVQEIEIGRAGTVFVNNPKWSRFINADIVPSRFPSILKIVTGRIHDIERTCKYRKAVF